MSEEPVDAKLFSFGDNAVGRNFNPSGNEKVDKLKELYAAIIDILNDDRGENRDDGLVEPYAADEFSSQIEPIYQHLLELTRSVNTPEDI